MAQSAHSSTASELASATNKSPYTPNRIRDDLTWYTNHVQPGTWLLDTWHNTLYVVTATDFETSHTITVQTGPQVTLTTGEQHDAAAAPSSDFLDAPRQSHVGTKHISDVAGALELGELIPIPDDQLLVCDGYCVLNRGSYAYVYEQGTTPSVISAAADSITRDPVNNVSLPDDTAFLHPDHDTVPFSVGEEESTYPYAETDVETHYFDVGEFKKETFEDATILRWVREQIDDGDRVLNATAGFTPVFSEEECAERDIEIVRNDINPDREADYHLDVAALTTELTEAEQFDVIIFDPPWSLYQSNLRYDGYHVHTTTNEYSVEFLPGNLPFTPYQLEDVEADSDTGQQQAQLGGFDTNGDVTTIEGYDKNQLGHASLAKQNFDFLLKPGGSFIEFTFHGTSMPGRLGYNRIERNIFDPFGEAKAVIGCVDEKPTPK
ncbi:hypothetical protein [Salinibaculum rarum]|uniref:hypothetical protein n=1 Tax=Salinibaculum rarum TaxID=3058903 RepID=UPI0026603C9C|nr:hypothetical protein [Salinibaculum sp. KK48]